MAAQLARREVLAGAGVAMGAAALAGCAGEAGEADEPADTAARTGVLATTSEVPVGSAVIVDGVVLTQAEPGVFAGFSAVCPHAGCAVSKVDGARVICPCHGSTFGLDGAVLSGPAQKPLAPAPVTVRGDSIVAG